MKIHNIDKNLYSEISSSSSFRSPIDVLEKLMHFLTLHSETKLLTSESSLRILYEMVVYKVLKSKGEVDLAFFFAMILCSFMTSGKEPCKI